MVFEGSPWTSQQAGESSVASRRPLYCAGSAFRSPAMHFSKPVGLVTFLLAFSSAAADDAIVPRRTENILFIMTDGLRWQEVFSGADEALLNKKDGGVTDVPSLRKDFWRDTPEARRAAVMPFTWSAIAKDGQIYGNANRGSVARVTNGKQF